MIRLWFKCPKTQGNVTSLLESTLPNGLPVRVEFSRCRHCGEPHLFRRSDVWRVTNEKKKNRGFRTR
jgi:hypothetical protein